ncbi:MAG: alcohol dehydrogenase catalytic domain-containing protein [Abditibacteriota bacterium]|nr:alcohol dehydrogenase catalytic domain-containing protein [Abditibacteriota bacterium]
MKTAKAAVFMGAGKPFEVRSFDVTEPPAGYGMSTLVASGICGTDIHMTHGTLIVGSPSIIGHEFIGRLEACDPAEAARYGLKPGDYVVADIAVPCGECLLCRTGDDANCVNMQVTNGGSIDEAPYLYGGYSQVNYTPLKNLIRVPEGVDPRAAAVFACPGPTVVHACRLAEQAGVRFEDIGSAVVQGAGPVGMFAIMYLKAKGVKKVIAVMRSDKPFRTRAAERAGADEVMFMSEGGVCDKLAAENGGLGPDLCFEASGAPEAIPVGIGVLRNRGVYLVPGQYSNSGGVEIQPQLITFKALRILGSSQYSVIDVRDYLEFLRSHSALESVILSMGSFYPVEDVNAAIEAADKGENVKTLLVP